MSRFHRTKAKDGTDLDNIYQKKTGQASVDSMDSFTIIHTDSSS